MSLSTIVPHAKLILKMVSCNANITIFYLCLQSCKDFAVHILCWKSRMLLVKQASHIWREVALLRGDTMMLR